MITKSTPHQASAAPSVPFNVGRPSAISRLEKNKFTDSRANQPQSPFRQTLSLHSVPCNSDVQFLQKRNSSIPPAQLHSDTVLHRQMSWRSRCPRFHQYRRIAFPYILRFFFHFSSSSAATLKLGDSQTIRMARAP